MVLLGHLLYSSFVLQRCILEAASNTIDSGVSYSNYQLAEQAGSPRLTIERHYSSFSMSITNTILHKTTKKSKSSSTLLLSFRCKFTRLVCCLYFYPTHSLTMGFTLHYSVTRRLTRREATIQLHLRCTLETDPSKVHFIQFN